MKAGTGGFSVRLARVHAALASSVMVLAVAGCGGGGSDSTSSAVTLGQSSAAAVGPTLKPTPAPLAETNAVEVWNLNAVTALSNGATATPSGLGLPPPVAFIHMAIVEGAVYDAVNAIKGGHDPYIPGLKAPTSASQSAAAATAAHHVLVSLVGQVPTAGAVTAGVKTAIVARLDADYVASLGEIPAGQAKEQGIEVGAQAATAMLFNRTSDGRYGAPGFPFADPAGPGQWRPMPGNDPNAWVRSVRPFTLPISEFFHTPGPALLTSAQYTAEFNEVKRLGRASGSERTDAQTSLAYFTAGHPLQLLYGALRQVSAARGLTVAEQARFHAMTSMSGADSLINCWAEKAHWGFWRPTTAIQLAADDGNPDTAPDAAWTSLLTLPPYADEPSGANCVFSGVMNGARAFFGSNAAEFDITSPGIGGGTGSTRHYSTFSAVVDDVIEARIFGGLHFRRADVSGAELGRRVAAHVNENFFNCGPPGQCSQEVRH